MWPLKEEQQVLLSPLALWTVQAAASFLCVPWLLSCVLVEES